MGGVSDISTWLEMLSGGFMGSFVLPFLAILAVFSILAWVVFR